VPFFLDDAIDVSFSQQTGDTIHKPGRGFNGSRGPIVRHDRIRPEFVIANRFQIVCLWQEPPQVHVDARLIDGQSRKFRVCTLVRLRRLAGSLEDKRLARLVARQISRASGILRQMDREHRPRMIKGQARFCQIAFGLRRHRSRPSRRISCISGVRSQYALSR
jgi:hypothetical protein